MPTWVLEKRKKLFVIRTIVKAKHVLYIYEIWHIYVKRFFDSTDEEVNGGARLTRRHWIGITVNESENGKLIHVYFVYIHVNSSIVPICGCYIFKISCPPFFVLRNNWIFCSYIRRLPSTRIYKLKKSTFNIMQVVSSSFFLRYFAFIFRYFFGCVCIKNTGLCHVYELLPINLIGIHPPVNLKGREGGPNKFHLLVTFIFNLNKYWIRYATGKWLKIYFSTRWKSKFLLRVHNAAHTIFKFHRPPKWSVVCVWSTFWGNRWMGGGGWWCSMLSLFSIDGCGKFSEIGKIWTSLGEDLQDFTKYHCYTAEKR